MVIVLICNIKLGYSIGPAGKRESFLVWGKQWAPRFCTTGAANRWEGRVRPYFSPSRVWGTRIRCHFELFSSSKNPWLVDRMLQMEHRAIYGPVWDRYATGHEVFERLAFIVAHTLRVTCLLSGRSRSSCIRAAGVADGIRHGETSLVVQGL